MIMDAIKTHYPRRIAAASLKLQHGGWDHRALRLLSAANRRGLIEAREVIREDSTDGILSAANRRGLIEAIDRGDVPVGVTAIIRGESPRPH